MDDLSLESPFDLLGLYHGVPVGLGPRVPMLVVSPWSRGGWVNSQIFDHTSIVRFLEARFGVAELPRALSPAREWAILGVPAFLSPRPPRPSPHQSLE